MNIKRLFNKDIIDIIKGYVIFLIIMFVTVLVVSKKIEYAFQTVLCFGSFLVILLVGYLVINLLAGKSLQISKFSKEDIKKNEELYRDILKEYSPILLAFIDNMQIDYDVSITSGLLDLKNKGYIKINDDDKIEVIKFDYYNLSLSERYIIENIKNGKVEISPNDNNFIEAIYEDGKKCKLLESGKSWPKVLKKQFLKLIIFTALLYIFTLFLMNVFSFDLVSLLESIPLIFAFGWFYISAFSILYQNNPYIRNKNAEEINKKLEGLKSYLSEYSLLKDKESLDITIWEDYLIYSVIFKQNKKILKEYSKYYN